MSSSTSSSSGARSARSLVQASLAFAGALAAALTLVIVLRGSELVAAGRAELRDRAALLPPLRAPRSGLPLALCLGDSTLADDWSWSRLQERELAGVAEVSTVWWQGLEPYHQYLLLGRALELRPEVVVLVAHLRLFWRDEPLWYPDLLTLLPPRELPRALWLPFYERGVSVPRVALASLLGAAGGDRLLLGFSGGRELARGAGFLAWLVPARAPRDPRSLAERRAERFARYAAPLYRGHPALVMLRAAVDLAVRGGARTLVVATPIPVSRLREAGLYDEDAFAQRIALLREATEQGGGELLDLHQLLDAEGFRDEFGHQTPAGARRVADAVAPGLGQALGLPEAP